MRDGTTFGGREYALWELTVQLEQSYSMPSQDPLKSSYVFEGKHLAPGSSTPDWSRLLQHVAAPIRPRWNVGFLAKPRHCLSHQLPVSRTLKVRPCPRD